MRPYDSDYYGPKFISGYLRHQMWGPQEVFSNQHTKESARPSSRTLRLACSVGDRECLLEMALKPDYAFVYAYKGDHVGNLTCHKTARNYNPEMAAAGRITIAAVEDLVEPGGLEPDMIHIPGVYVQRVVKVDRPNYLPTID